MPAPVCLKTNKWYAAIGEETFANAILNRLTHSSYRIELKGGSLEKTVN